MSWLYWELGLPLMAPAVVFFGVFLIFRLDHTGDSFVKALISISGSGDLLVFAALLLINIGAKLRILGIPKRSMKDLESGESNPDTPFLVAFAILSFYLVARVTLETHPFDDGVAIRFAYGFASVLILLMVVLWIDGTVRKMHTDLLKYRLSSGLIESQYNRG
jgi:hypothetical protein